MNHQEITGLMGSLAPTIAEFVSKAMVPLRAENERLSSTLMAVEKRFDEWSATRDQDRVVFIGLVKEEIAKIELPKDGKDADPEAMKSAVIDVVAHILPGEVLAAVSAIEKPKDGKDADQDVIKAEVLHAVLGKLNELVPVEVTAAVGKIEKPKDGKDADPADVAMMVSAEVSKAVGAIEKPADGKSVTADDVRPMLAEMVAALPIPQNGKDADPELIRALVVAEVAKIEPPKDGKDGEPGAPGQGVDIQDLIPAIATQVEMAVVSELEKIALPEGKQGEPGKSVSVDDVRPLIEELVAALPKAVDGKDADPAEVAALIIEDVAKRIPVPADGKSVAIEDVLPLLEEMVAALPKPENGNDGSPGVDGKSLTVDDVRPLLEDMVSALPKAQNGKDADPAEIASLIVDDVAKLIPRPADGKSVTLEEIAPLVDDAAAKRLPTSFLVNEAGVLVAVYANSDPKSVGKVRGEDGLRGASVMDGAVDEDGTLVLRMSDGRIIQAGAVRGAAGEDGKDGQKGERGRDAHEIQILPGIDEHKSYAEGVVACWRGGVIRSERQTDPIVDGDIVAAGWRVFVRGIAEEHETDVEDGRFIERTTVYTDGTEFKRRIKTVTPIYQGVWKDGANYLKGDNVTWAGSSFIAQRDTSDKPEVSDSWKLAIKRGRDGKDGKIDRPPPVVKLDPDKR